MKKGILFTLLIIFGVFFITNTSLASWGITKVLGGRVIFAPKAMEIIEAEAMGFTCAVPGQTFNILPVGHLSKGPYIITGGSSGKGGGSITVGKWVIGTYSTIPTVIACINPIGVPKMILANPAVLYGTSK